MFIAWGPELALLYNHAYVELLEAKHPAALDTCHGAAIHRGDLRLRLEREFAEVQRKLRSLQELGEKGPILEETLRRKLEIGRALAAIDVPKELQ